MAYLYLTDSFDIRGQGYYPYPSWVAGSVVLNEAHSLADVICYYDQMIKKKRSYNKKKRKKRQK